MSRLYRLECERLESRLTPSAVNERFVTQVYEEILGRQPDGPGLAYWGGQLDQGAARTQVARAFLTAPEARSLQVQDFYLRLLGRSADAGGLSYHLGLLNGGATLEQVQAGMMGSAEYLQARGQGTTDGFLDALYADALELPVDDAGRAFHTAALNGGASRAQVATAVLTSEMGRAFQVRGYYHDFLGRQPDASGSAYFVGSLNAGARAEDVMSGMVGSDEFFTFRVNAGGPPNQAFVQQVYLDHLNRPADAAGRTYWVNYLNAGGNRTQMVRQIDTSPEFRNLQIQDYFEAYLGRAADNTGLTYYRGRLEAGATQEQVQIEITASAEYYSQRGRNDREEFLAALYADALDRPIDANSLFDLSDALARGATTRAQVAAMVFTSGEYRAELVTEDYQDLLDRAPDAAGMNYFMSLLNGGVRSEEVAAQLLGSPEYDNSTVAGAMGTLQGQTTGKFVNPAPGGAAVTGVNTASILYGTPFPGDPNSGRSGLDFLGGAFTGDAGQDVTLGQLTFTNRGTTTGSAISSIKLSLTITLTGVNAPTFLVPLVISNTINTGDPFGDPDVVTLSVPLPLSFDLGNGAQQQLTVKGFRDGPNAAVVKSFTVSEGDSNTVELVGSLAQKKLTPGIYLGARELNSAVPGTHQYLILVPQNPAAFTGKYTPRDLGDGTLGIVIGGHNINGRLVMEPYNAADFQATREFDQPDKYVSGFGADFDAVVARANLGGTGKSIDANIQALLTAADFYAAREEAAHIPYPLDGGLTGKYGSLNSNSWAQSILEYIIGPGVVPQNLSWNDIRAGNRIGQGYFK